jgi:nucleoid-associated protein YgaU
MRRVQQLVRPGVVIGDAVVLAALWPDWGRVAHGLAAPRDWLDRVGTDEAVLTLATTALWCVAAWIAIGLGAASASALPGAGGRVARRIAVRLLPAVLLRTVAGVAGFGVLVAPVAPVAAGARVSPPAAMVAAAVPTPTWPTDADPVPRVHVGWPTSPSARPGPPSRPTHAAPEVIPDQPPGTPARPRGGAAQVRPRGDRPAQTPPDGRSVQAPPGGQSAQAGPGGQPVQVRSGDSLWLIAARRLGPQATDMQVATAWPRWYAANRSVIGDDPALIEPGQLLRAPHPSDAFR